MGKNNMKEKEEQYLAYINALKGKENKTKGDKAVIWADNVTSKVFIPIPNLFTFPIGLIMGIIGLSAKVNSLLCVAIGILSITFVDIIYYSIKNK